MDKKNLRKQYKEKRAELSDEDRALLSQMIADNLLQWQNLTNKKVSIFLPIERFHEINTWYIIEALNARFSVPVVAGKELKHILLESKDQLEISQWGIPEPSYGEEIQPEEIDIVLTPLLVCDSKGNRVGYGAGFYDGFLKSCSPECQFVGLSFFEPIDEIPDIHTSDIPLNFCVTPNSVHSFL